MESKWWSRVLRGTAVGAGSLLAFAVGARAQERSLRGLVGEELDIRLESLRVRLLDEVSKRQADAMQALDDSVSQRIGVLELRLAEHAAQLESVAAANAESGRKVERLLQAVDQLAASRQGTKGPVSKKDVKVRTSPSRRSLPAR